MKTLTTTVLVGISLSMDAFSLALIYGTTNLKRPKIFLIALVVAIYHFFMPLLGSQIGTFILSKILINPHHLVAIIFMIIAVEMLISNTEVTTPTILNVVGIIMFGLAVSIDSFLTGIGLVAINKNLIQAGAIFSVISFMFTYLGLIIGQHLAAKYGRYATITGGVLLIIISIYYLTN